MGRQIENLAEYSNPAAVSIVVGYKKDMIMEAFPDVSFIYNQNFGETNTSKSLLKALRQTGSDPVLWLNGDVVFEPDLLGRLLAHIAADRSFVSVNTAQVGEEEVKYRLGPDGQISELSKAVIDGLGEAVGINFVSGADKPFLVARLADCGDQDYFERGIEMAIEKDGRRFSVVDVSDSLCIEVDFAEDLEPARTKRSADFGTDLGEPRAGMVHR